MKPPSGRQLTINMNLPLRLVKFWYPQALQFFLLTWRNLISLLEEDLAVGLMVRLLFVPLFHDSTIVGKVLSFSFRAVRILLGLLAFALVTVILSFMAVLWFVAPIALPAALFFSQVLVVLFSTVLVLGAGLFIDGLRLNLPKKVWHIKDLGDIFHATRLKKANLNLPFLLQTPEVMDFLQNLEVSPDKFARLEMKLSDQVLQRAWELAKSTQAAEITPAYFFVAFLFAAAGIEALLLALNLTPDDVSQALGYFELRRKLWRRYMIWDEEFAIRHLKGVNRGWLGSPTPLLDAVSEDLTKQAAKFKFADFTGRQAVVTQVVSILSQAQDRNVLLVGPPGSGRSTLVNYLAKIIVSGDAPEALATKRIVALDLTKLMSLMASEGDLAQRVKEIFQEAAYAENVILYIDEIHNLGLGQAGTEFNLYSLMQPFLESSKLQFIGSTDPASYTKVLERNGSFARIFHKVDVPLASAEETRLVLYKRCIDLARYQKIHVSYLAIKEMVELAVRLIHDRVLPDSALSILVECQPAARNSWITSQTVKEVVGRLSHVPVLEVDPGQRQTLLKLEDIIHRRLIDQEEAVRAVANTLRRAATALREQSRPIGSFLFVGPTGVGKTELAKTLAAVYFKSEAAFLQFDMSEYQTEAAVDRLIGTADSPGELTELIKRKPYCLLLLDEFEKANPKILTLFLQVFEEGRLTDFSGNHVDFSNTIIIATSNAASLTIAEGLGKGLTVQQILPQVRSDLLRTYRPELLNRFDEVVVFKPLSKANLQKIVQIKLAGLQKQLKEQGYLVEFTPQVVIEIVRRGFDPVLGARPMRRLIQDTLEADLSRMILENKLSKGQKFVCNKAV